MSGSAGAATFSVRSLCVARASAPPGQAEWMRASGPPTEIAFQVVLLRSADANVLINTGPPVAGSQEAMRLVETSAEALDPPVLGTKQRDLVTQLGRLGVAPEDVTHVILTPLQYYTTGNLLAFPHAEILLSRRGWVHWHTTHDHPHDQRWQCFSQETLVELVTTSWPRVQLLDDEETVLPGLRAWWAGGHHRASMVIEVDTTVGTVAITDTAMTLDSIERDRPMGISENIYETLAAYRRMRETAGHFVPIYDQSVFVRYPDGIVAD